MSETRIDDLNLYDSGVNVWIAVETEAREWIENLGSDDVDAELEKCFSTTVVDFLKGYNVPGYNNLDNPDSISDRIEFLQGLDGYSDYEHILTNYMTNEMAIQAGNDREGSNPQEVKI